MDFSEDAEFGEAGEVASGLGFLQDKVEFVADAVAADAFEEGQGVGDEFSGAAFDAEAEALFEADGAQYAGGVVHKTDRVKGADESVAQVALAAPEVEHVAESAAVEAEGEGVDGEVAAVQVEFDAGVFNFGQGRGLGVEFGAGRDEVEMGEGSVGRQFPLGRAETLMSDDPATEGGGATAGEGGGVAFDDEIKIGGGQAEEEIADKAADDEERDVEFCRCFRDVAQEVELIGGEGGGELIGEVAAQAGGPGRGGESLEEV